MNERLLLHIDRTRLVEDIHQAEALRQAGAWYAHAIANDLPLEYRRYVTALYTLRAYLRGRLHRNNPPPEVRDYNRAARQDPSLQRGPMWWNRLEHNRELALRTAPRYQAR
jgi:hypothetical protein